MWYIFEGLIMIVAVTTIVSQVIYPTVMGTRMFPMFRRRILLRELSEARERREQDRLAQEASELWSHVYGSDNGQASDESDAARAAEDQTKG